MIGFYLLLYILEMLILLGALFLLSTKPIVDLRDKNMSSTHKKSYERPLFTWKTQGRNSNTVVLTDCYLKKADKMRSLGYKTVIAYLLEPRAIDPKPYHYVMKNLKKFDLVLTYDEQLLRSHPEKCEFVHAVGSSTLFDHALHTKSKMCSIFTGKNWTEGHRLRHLALERYGEFFDGVKTDETPRVPWKDPWLKDFFFSVAIENSKQDYYFTEKIIDCFRSGTIPIYWGCPSIGRFFDLEGIIVFHDLDELGDILQNLSIEEYEKRREAIRRNFQIASQYPQCNLIERPHLPDAMDGIWLHARPFFK